ncbi:MAG: OmpA family protein [Gemmatimonadota bacterium]
MRKLLLLLAGTLSLVSLPIMAQEKGTIELGGFGRYTHYDKSFNDIGSKRQNSYGGGGRLAYFFSPSWALEADGSFNATDLTDYFIGFRSTPVRYWPFHLKLMYEPALGKHWNFLLGAGAGLNHYGKSNATVLNPTIFGNDVSIGGLTGFRYKVNNWLSLRLDGTLDYMPSPRNGTDEVRSQANGVQLTEVPSNNVHLGLQLGLSIFPNGKCTKRLDAIDLTPATASVQTGQTVSFSTTGRLCDGSSTTPQVTYTASCGTISASGQFVSSQAGTCRVIAQTLNGKLADTSTVTVTAPPPPPPPPPAPRLTRIEISPKTATLKLGESQAYTVTGFWSDGNSRALTASDCSLTADGNPTSSGWTYTWSRSGDYTITATCTGNSDRATAQVRGLQVTLRAMFGPNRYTTANSIDKMTLDQVASNLKSDPSLRIYIDGHTDWRNSVKYNNWLAGRRAEFIARELTKRGVPRDHMVLRAFGECKPIADNGTEEGMTQNRRVEVNQIETSAPENADNNCADTGPKGVSKIGRPGE